MLHSKALAFLPTSQLHPNMGVEGRRIVFHSVEAFVESLKIEQFWGVGKITAQKMHKLGIYTGKGLKAYSEAELVEQFGKSGLLYYQNARGIDTREVVPERIRKLLGAENTFLSDIDSKERLQRELSKIAEEVWRRISDRQFYGRTVMLKIKYEDFELITRRKTAINPIRDYEQFYSFAKKLLELVDFQSKKVRLVELTMSHTDSDLKIPYSGQPTIVDFGVNEVVDAWEE